MSFTQLLQVLWARRGLIVLVVAMAVSAAVAARFNVPRKYVAISSWVVDARGVDPITGTAVTPAPSAANVLATQVDVISSRTGALKVVDALHLTTHKFTGASHPRPSQVLWRKDWAAQLLSGLSARPMADSNVIKIKFEHSDPAVAAQVANAFAEQYLQANLELKLDRASGSASG